MNARVIQRKECTDCPLSYDAEEWQRLELVGYEVGVGPEGEHRLGVAYEIRSCRCTAMLKVHVPELVLERRVRDVTSKVARTAATTLVALLVERLEWATREVRIARRELAVERSRMQEAGGV